MGLGRVGVRGVGVMRLGRGILVCRSAVGVLCCLAGWIIRVTLGMHVGAVRASYQVPCAVCWRRWRVRFMGVCVCGDCPCRLNMTVGGV